VTLRRQGRNFASGDARSPGHRPHALQVTLHQGRFLHSLPMTLCQGRWPHPLPVTLCQGRWRYSLQVTLCQGRWRYSLQVTLCHRGEKRLHGYRQLTHPCSFLPLAYLDLIRRQAIQLVYRGVVLTFFLRCIRVFALTFSTKNPPNNLGNRLLSSLVHSFDWNLPNVLL